MYIDFKMDKDTSTLKVVERVNGQRQYREFPLVLEFFVPDSSGRYQGYDGVRLKQIKSRKLLEFYGERKRAVNAGQKTYEAFFNLPNKVLYEHYLPKDVPELHTSFLDIECDRLGHENYTITQMIYNADCPINAVSVYNNWQDKLYTLMLCPENLTMDEAREIASKFENTYVMSDEKDLLIGLISILEDCDIVSGWNCVDENTNVWCTNEIKKIKNILEKESLLTSKVVRKSTPSMKEAYKINLVNGMSIVASKDHKFPAIVKGVEHYTSLNTSNDIEYDYTVENLLDIIDGKEDEIFFKLNLHKNINKTMTYRDYILANLDYVLEMYDPCFSNLKKIKIDFKKSRTKQRCYSWIKDKITREEIIDYIKNESELKLFSTSYSGHFMVNLNEEISNDFIHCLGAVYTDGTLDKKNNTIAIYNTNENFIHKIFDSLNYLKHEKKRRNTFDFLSGADDDGIHNPCGRFRIGFNSIFGLLLGFIYDKNGKKSININSLSKLSEQQLDSFFSGLIDGDGTVGSTMSFCNYNNNDIYAIQELLLWNGYYTSTFNNNLTFPIFQNSVYKERFNFWVDYKQDKLLNLNDVEKKNRKAKASEVKYRVVNENTIYCRVKDIEKMNDLSVMYDIETDTHYFYGNGIATHNCNGFDIPYIVRRVSNLLGVDGARKLCLFDETPVEKEEFSMGQRHLEYTLPGKWSADYMLLYKKHQTSVKESYKLNSIAIDELGEQKVEYTGTLDDLYRDDYENFIRYNRQDTMLVKRLEDKLKYIEIHNRQAHSIRCSLENTMGTVAWVDQAIVNKAHDLNLRVPDKIEGKNPEFEDIIPPGAYVATPKTSLVEHVFSYDINSLYPNTCIAVNISPETILAQIKLDKTIPYLWKKIEDNNLWSKKSSRIPDWGKAWGGDDLWGTLEYQAVMKQTDDVLTLKIEATGQEVQRTAKQIYDMIFAENSNMSISGLGTIYRTDVDGLIPTIFTEWYIERKKQKAKKERYETLLSGVTIDDPDLLSKIQNELNK